MKEIAPQYLAQQGLSKTFPERFWRKVSKNGSIPDHVPGLGTCWQWLGSVTTYGYGKMWRGRKQRFGKAKVILSNRACWILTRGPIPSGLIVCHHCDKPACVNPDHLFIGTKKDNSEDMVQKGRCKPPAPRIGQQNKKAVLTDAEAKEIGRLYKPWEMTTGMLAKRFGVRKDVIRGVLFYGSYGGNGMTTLQRQSRALSDSDESKIKRLYSTGKYSMLQLANQFSVSRSLVLNVVHGKGTKFRTRGL